MKTTDFMKREWAMWLVMLVPLVFVLIKWNEFAEQVPTHWNIHGEVDKYSGKWALFLSPMISLGVYLLLLFVPRIDPRKKNFDLFRGTYWVIRVLVTALLSLLGVITALAALQVKMNVGLIVEVSTLCMFLVMGNQFGRIRPNYFVGLRTPWTLNNEEVWMKTHRLAGRIWVGGSLVMLPVMFLCPSPASSYIYFAYIAVLTIVPVVYSWKIYKEKQA